VLLVIAVIARFVVKRQRREKQASNFEHSPSGARYEKPELPADALPRRHLDTDLQGGNQLYEMDARRDNSEVARELPA
jgi:hypothetical protein